MSVLMSFLLSTILASLGLYKKSFTKAGLLMAFIITFIICYCGGIIAFLGIVSLFLITIITDKIRIEEKRHIEEDKHEKKNKRDVIQVLANLLIAAIIIIVYKFTNNRLFMISYFSSIAISAADTSASGIGILSKKSFNILTLKKSERGISGNVSKKGFIASFLAAFLISIICFINYRSYTSLVIVLAGFLGALIDSVLGCFQVKYKCIICNTITERKKHCNKNTKYYKGLKCLDNDCVNFLSNLLITCTALLFLLLIA